MVAGKICTEVKQAAFDLQAVSLHQNGADDFVSFRFSSTLNSSHVPSSSVATSHYERRGVMEQKQSENVIGNRSFTNQESESLRLDYEQTTELFRMLADIRFKLLAFVPTLTGVAVSLLAGDKVGKGTALAVGILGFIVTLGIVLYELRNSLFYDLSISRAARLEGQLKFPRFTKLRGDLNKPGGVFTERPPGKEPAFGPGEQDPLSQKFLGIIQVKHDIGLALIYGASLGGWTFIVINVLPLVEPFRSLLSLFIAILVAGLTIWEFKRLDKERYEWQFGRGDKEKHVVFDNLYNNDL